MDIKFNALLALPTQENLNDGSIYYLSDGSHYVTDSNKNLIKISDVIFVNELPETGFQDKIYILTSETDNGVYSFVDNAFKPLITKDSDVINYGLNIKASVSNLLELMDLTDSVEGDLFIINEGEEEGDIYKYTQSTYQFLANIKGQRGLNGVDGVNGEKGDVGDKGDKGDPGVQGIRGVQGAQGEKGDVGDSFTITKSYPTITALNADFNNPNIPEGAFVIISSDNPDTDEDNGKVYIKDASSYRFISVLRGLRGERGERGIQGVQGVQGERGEKGEIGQNGTNGESAYEIAVRRGFIGTEQQWLDSLHAPKKALLVAGFSANIAVPEINAKIPFNRVVTNGLNYNSSTGDFTLQQGRRYRIQCKLAILGGSWVQFRLDNNTSNTAVNLAEGLALNTNYNGDINGAHMYIVFDCTQTGTYSVRVNGRSGADVNLRSIYTNLIVEEV
jgi:hypothetical protein